MGLWAYFRDHQPGQQPRPSSGQLQLQHCLYHLGPDKEVHKGRRNKHDIGQMDHHQLPWTHNLPPTGPTTLLASLKPPTSQGRGPDDGRKGDHPQGTQVQGPRNLTFGSYGSLYDDVKGPRYCLLARNIRGHQEDEVQLCHMPSHRTFAAKPSSSRFNRAGITISTYSNGSFCPQ